MMIGKIFQLPIFLLSFSLFASVDVSEESRQWHKAAEELTDTFVFSSRALVHLRDLSAANQFRSKISEIEGELKKDVRATLAYVESYLAKSKNRISLDDDITMRLAQLYYKNSNYLLQEEMDAYHDKLAAYYVDRSGKLPEIPKPDFSKTLFYATKLLKNYPRSGFRPYALYLTGVIEEENSNFEEALKSYEQIVKQFPFSKHRPEALWRSAELNFDFGKSEKAKTAYSELAEMEKSEYRTKALYKLGAIHFREVKYKKAKKIFLELHTSLEATKEDRLSTSLLREVYEYLGLISLKGVSLEEQPEALELEALKAAGQRLERHNQFSEARSIYRDYIDKNYYNPQVPAYYDLLISSYENDGKIKASLAHREKLLSHIRNSGKWWNKNKDNEVRFKAEYTLKENYIFLARYYAGIGFDEQSMSSLKKAEQFYSKYLRSGYGEKESLVHYELAQVLVRLREKSKAIASFKQALDSGISSSDRSYAAYSIFQLTTEVLKYKAVPRVREIDLTEAKSLSSKEKKIEEQYRKILPELVGSNFEIPSAYFMGQLYLSRSQYDNAKLIFARILDTREVTTDQITYIEDSAKWLVELYSQEKNWAGISRVNEKLKNKGAKTQIETADLGKMHFNNSILAEAEVEEAKGNFIGAAVSFLDFAKKNPKNFEADRALFKAAQLLRRSRQFERSNQNLKKIFNTEYRKEVLRMYVQNLLDSFKFKAADQFVRTLSKSDLATDSSLKSVQSLKAFLSNNNDSGDRFAQQYRKNKKWEFGVRAAKEYIYSMEHKKAKDILVSLKKSPVRKLEIRGLELISSWVQGEANRTLSQCDEYSVKYGGAKKVSEFEQNISYMCISIRGYLTEKMVTKAVIDEIYNSKAWEAFVFASILNAQNSKEILDALEIGNDKALAISNFAGLKAEQKGAYQFKRQDIFPFHIARDRNIPWRPIVRNTKAFDYESFCQKVGYGSCYRKLEKSGQKSKRFEYDLLAKIALILDRQKEAYEWYSQAKAAGFDQQMQAMGKVWSSSDLSESTITDAIYKGTASLDSLLQLTKLYYQDQQYRKASYVIREMSKQFQEDALASEVYSFLSISNVRDTSDLVYDPRVWFLQKLGSSSKAGRYIPKKRLLQGSEWYKSLRLARSVVDNKDFTKFRKSESAYYQILSSYKFYQIGDLENQEAAFERAKNLTKNQIWLSPVSKVSRGVASEDE